MPRLWRDTGDFIDFPDLGIRLTCKSGGVAEPSFTQLISNKGSFTYDNTCILTLDLVSKMKNCCHNNNCLKVWHINVITKENVIGPIKPHTHVSSKIFSLWKLFKALCPSIRGHAYMKSQHLDNFWPPTWSSILILFIAKAFLLLLVSLTHTPCTITAFLNDP